MSPAKRAGLGRGLGQLIQNTDPEPRKTRPVDEVIDSQNSHRRMPEGSHYLDIPIDAVTPNPHQPRTEFDEDKLHELVESIAEVGLLQPIVVRPLDDDQYELVMGERRLRAAKQAGLTKIPAIVRPTEEADMLRDALLENLHRAQLNPLEEANAYQQMLDDFGCTHEELATRIKRSRPQITNTIRLLKLPPSVQRRVAAGVLSSGHARALLGLTDQLAQERLAQRIVAEGLSVRATEEAVLLGDGNHKPATNRTPAEPSPRAVALTERLTDHFDTRAKVHMGKKKGRITIEFASDEDLDRILALMNVNAKQ